MQHYTHKSKHRRVVMKKLTVAQKTARRLCCICILLMWILSSKSTPADSLHWTATPYAMSSTQCERQISNTFCSTKMTALSVTRTAHDIHLQFYITAKLIQTCHRLMPCSGVLQGTGCCHSADSSNVGVHWWCTQLDEVQPSYSNWQSLSTYPSMALHLTTCLNTHPHR